MSRVEEIVSALRNLIKGDRFENNRLPSEPDLADRMGASRNTLRQALTTLEMEGLLYRKHGVGTFINSRILNIGTRLDEVWDFAEMIEVSGYQPGVRNVHLTLENPSPEVAEALGLSLSEEVLETANVFLADDTPVIFCVDFIPAKLVRSAYDDQELYGPVYQFLEKRCHQQVDHNLTEILPLALDQTLSEYLSCQVGDPAHYFKEIAFNADKQPIMYSDEYYRPEFFSFHILRKLTSR